jgi:DNA-binding NarL/FixJ family response regulator
VVVLSSVPEQVEGLRALNAGARGYCHLLAAPVLLQEVAQVVSLGGLWVGPDLVQRLMAATRELLQRSPDAVRPAVDLSVLSERELQVARAVAEGQSNREVAEQLHITERTVKAHLGAVFEKLGLRDRVQLVLQLAQVKSYA